MTKFQVKLSVLIGLSILFLGYSFKLYTSDSYHNPVVANSQAVKGKILWQEKNCQACHQLYGLGGHLGPDLTNVYHNRSENYIRAFLKSGTKVMPDFELTPQEMNELMAFLSYVNSTGESSPTHFIIQKDGTIKNR